MCVALAQRDCTGTTGCQELENDHCCFFVSDQSPGLLMAKSMEEMLLLCVLGLCYIKLPPKAKGGCTELGSVAIALLNMSSTQATSGLM